MSGGHRHSPLFPGRSAPYRAPVSLRGAGRFLELHLYLTAALGKSDVRAVGLQLALDLLAAKEHKDSITGLRARTQPGRPDWSKARAGVGQPLRAGHQKWHARILTLSPSPSHLALGVWQGGRGEEGEGAGLLLRLSGVGQGHQSALRALRLPLLQGKLLTWGGVGGTPFRASSCGSSVSPGAPRCFFFLGGLDPCPSAFGDGGARRRSGAHRRALQPRQPHGSSPAPPPAPPGLEAAQGTGGAQHPPPPACSTRRALPLRALLGGKGAI